jgi:hypothetical protein
MINRANYFPATRFTCPQQYTRPPPLRSPLPSTPRVLPCLGPPSLSAAQRLRTPKARPMVIWWTGSDSTFYHHNHAHAPASLLTLLIAHPSFSHNSTTQDANQAGLRAPRSSHSRLAPSHHPDFCRPLPGELAATGSFGRASPQG